MSTSSLLRPGVFLLLLTSVLFALPEVRAQPRPLKNEVAFYIDTYGEVLPAQDPEVVRSHRVFERVRAVADKNSKRLPQLVVVNSRADPWAIERPQTAVGDFIGNVDASGEGGGRIFIRGGELVADNAWIDTRGSGEAEGIDIGVTGQVTVRNGAGIGASGDLTVEAGNLEVRNGAEINTNAFGPGQGGNVKINATDITLQDGGRISAENIGAADAGNITLEVGNLLRLSNDSSIITSAAGGTDKGGNITLNSVFVILDGSQIVAKAFAGHGGNIRITSDFFFQSPDSRVSAESGNRELSGTVVIDAPDTDIIAGFAGLPANFLDAATALTQLCAERSGANVSSLVVRKYEVLPDSPYALWVQLPKTAPDGTGWTAAVRDISAWKHPPLALTCLGR